MALVRGDNFVSNNVDNAIVQKLMTDKNFAHELKQINEEIKDFDRSIFTELSESNADFLIPKYQETPLIDFHKETIIEYLINNEIAVPIGGHGVIEKLLDVKAGINPDNKAKRK